MAKRELLHCPCVNERYCGTMIQSMKLHRLMYDSAFHKFIHSRKGLNYLIETFDSKTSVVEAIHKAYKDLR